MADGWKRKLPDGGDWSAQRWNEVRTRALKTKDPVCAICHHPIDMEAKAGEPNSCEVDHIVPIARGGAPYDIDNLQLTHRKCNRQKGTKMDGDYAELKETNLCPLSNNW